MLPNKIYLNGQELQDTTTCERIVSCNEAYGDMIEEYINLKQIWHDASEEPQQDILMLGIDCEGASIYKWTEQNQNGWFSFIKDTGLSKWAYISDLLPKGGDE